MFCILVKLPSPPIPYLCVERIELCRGSPDKACWAGGGLWQSWCREPEMGGLRGGCRAGRRDIGKRAKGKSQQRQNRFWKWFRCLLYWTSQSGPLLLRRFSCQHLSLSKKTEVCFLLQSIVSASPREDKKGASNAIAVSLHGYPLGNAPSYYLTHQSLTLQRIHCPEIISSATLWHVKIRNVSLLRARVRMWECRGAVKSLLGHTAEHWQSWHGENTSRFLRDFIQILLGEMIEALHRDLEAVLEGSCVAFQAQLWKR